MKFRGWIPNSLGRLSFSLFDDENKNNNLKTFIFSEPCRKVYGAYTQKYLSDSIIPEFINRFLLSERGIEVYFSFYILGYSSAAEHDVIEGQCYITIGKLNFDKTNKNLKNIKLNQSSSKVDDCKSEVELYIFRCEKLKEDDNLLALINFKLDRTGVVTLEVEKSQDFNSNSTIIQQSYFFIKDLFHKHKFHSPETDALIFCRKIESEQDIEWRNQTLFDLYRYCVKRNRMGITEENYNKILGILSYIDTFSEIYKESNKEEYENNHRIKFYMNSMIKVINAQYQENLYIKNNIKENYRYWVTLILSIFAVSISIISIYMPYYVEKYSQDAIYDNIAKIILLFVHNNPINFLSPIVGFMGLVLFSEILMPKKGFYNIIQKIQYPINRLILSSNFMVFALKCALLLFIFIIVYYIYKIYF